MRQLKKLTLTQKHKGNTIIPNNTHKSSIRSHVKLYNKLTLLRQSIYLIFHVKPCKKLIVTPFNLFYFSR